MPKVMLESPIDRNPKVPALMSLLHEYAKEIKKRNTEIKEYEKDQEKHGINTEETEKFLYTMERQANQNFYMIWRILKSEQGEVATVLQLLQK